MACQQALLFSDDTREAVQTPSDDHRCWKALAALADDDILGVRIGLARLVGAVYGMSNMLVTDGVLSQHELSVFNRSNHP